MSPIRSIASLVLASSLLLMPAAHFAEAVEPGATAPALGLEKLLQAAPGAVASWDALSGKVVVLEFWATWCGPCIGQIPHVNQLIEKFKDRPVQFISITDEDESIVGPFLKHRPMSAWIGLDTNQSMLDAYQVFSIPHMVLVDKAGKIAAVVHPAQLSEQLLEDLLGGRSVNP